MTDQTWTLDQLRSALDRYEGDLRGANMTPETIQSYTDRAHRFISWLSGDYKPHIHQDRVPPRG